MSLGGRIKTVPGGTLGKSSTGDRVAARWQAGKAVMATSAATASPFAQRRFSVDMRALVAGTEDRVPASPSVAQPSRAVGGRESADTSRSRRHSLCLCWFCEIDTACGPEDLLRNLAHATLVSRRDLPRLAKCLDELGLAMGRHGPVADESRHDPIVSEVLTPALELFGRLAQLLTEKRRGDSNWPAMSWRGVCDLPPVKRVQAF